MCTILRCTLALLLAAMVWPVPAHAESGGYVGASCKAVKETYLRRGIGVKVGTGRYSDTVGRRRVLGVTEHRGPGAWVYITPSLGKKPPAMKWKRCTASTFFEAQGTASGRYYGGTGDGWMMVAHKSLPLGTKLRLRYRGRTCEVRVQDRGPYVGGRELDLAWGPAHALGIGETVVTLDYAVIR